MKQGKNPTARQMKVMEAMGLNPKNWLVSKNESDKMTVVHRETGLFRVVPIEKE